MNTKEAYLLIQTALGRYNLVDSILAKEKDISANAKEEYTMCNHTLRAMGQLALCLTENCNRAIGALTPSEYDHKQASNRSTINRYNK